MILTIIAAFSFLASSAESGKETYSVYFEDTTPQEMKMEVGEPFHMAFEKFKILEIKEDGEVILCKWEERERDQR
jgi:hypothetical protein